MALGVSGSPPGREGDAWLCTLDVKRVANSQHEHKILYRIALLSLSHHTTSSICVDSATHRSLSIVAWQNKAPGLFRQFHIALNAISANVLSNGYILHVEWGIVGI